MANHDNEVGAAAWRGLVAAMAMSGMRELTRSAGLIRKPPPDEIADEGMPGLFSKVPGPYREAAIELAHWGYGSGMGVVYGMLPRRVRSSSWFGTAFGLAIWAGYEAAIAPALGIQGRKNRPVKERLAVAGDHVLYGVVVSHRPFDPTA